MKLKVPPGARPASERVRQAIFSSLGESIDDARVLDLYCGSGAYGLEALSRGAAEATFVDRDENAIAASRTNAAAAGFSDASRMHRTPVEKFLRRQSEAQLAFDLVFVDPPYALGDQGERLLDALSELVTEGGRVVVEARWSEDEPPVADGFELQADRRYGDTRVLVFLRRGES